MIDKYKPTYVDVTVDNISRMIPCDDKAIFIDGDGFPHRRVAIGWLNDAYDSTVFLSEDGTWLMPEYCTNGYTLCNQGDTVSILDLDDSFKMLVDEWNLKGVFSRYVKVDPSELVETVRIMLYPDTMNFRGVYAFSYANRLPGLDIYRYDAKTLACSMNDEADLHIHLANILVDYSRFLGKKVEVEVYMDKSPINKVQINKMLDMERKYLPSIRRKIQETFDDLWNNSAVCNKKKVLPEAITEFDRNPKL